MARQTKITQGQIYTQTFKNNIVHSKKKLLMTCMSAEDYIIRTKLVRFHAFFFFSPQYKTGEF